MAHNPANANLFLTRLLIRDGTECLKSLPGALASRSIFLLLRSDHFQKKLASVISYTSDRPSQSRSRSAQDFGLLAFELFSGDDASVTQVSELSELVR
jgi:hypothetical protein